jgi:hypothetical protein
MGAEIIDLAKERARRRPDQEPVLPLPAAVPPLWDYEDVVGLVRYFEAQIG